MIIPYMELFLVIFQVFHDFQSLWEPCPVTFFPISDKKKGIKYSKVMDSILIHQNREILKGKKTLSPQDLC